MKYTRKFEDCQTAADSLLEYIGDGPERILMGILLEGATDRQMRFYLAFAGVQGYPVSCWLKESKNLMASW